ncbi:MAG: ATP-binding cassette domain-containing protein [Acidobacteria bacterium]|nr:ATP-binding cassette domain-containing protein [Acidobacteriota bacterium]
MSNVFAKVSVPTSNHQPETHRPDHPADELPCAIEARAVSFAYAAARPVLRDVDLIVRPGEFVMLVGASGGGKTTLLKLARGFISPTRGSILVLGRNPAPRRSAWGVRRLDPRVAYIPQQLGLVRSMTAIENVLAGALGRIQGLGAIFRSVSEQDRREALALLDDLRIAHKAEEKVALLSGGERQRVAIARALMQRPQLILADEFISQLDPATGADILASMQRAARSGTALLASTHNIEIVARYADRVVLLSRGVKTLDCAANQAPVDQLTDAMRE